MEGHDGTPTYQGRDNERYKDQGYNRVNNREIDNEPICNYYQVLGYLSRDYPLRLRHKVEKQAELDKLNSRLSKMQVVMIDLEDPKRALTQRVNETQEGKNVPLEILALNFSEKGKQIMEAS